MKIRYAYINQLVLKTYSSLRNIEFPINAVEIVGLIPNCKYISYQEFAKINHCSVEDVINMCGSASGCTNYDVSSSRYLILCNESFENYNNSGRQRWTCAHEIGHILCDHHCIAMLDDIEKPDFEAEADYYAATLLSPLPLFKLLNINSPIDVQNVFGLSSSASLLRYNQYLSWKRDHRKTAWENDIVNLIKYKSGIYSYR